MLSTLSKKIVMCLTGLFLCFFLIIHFLGNLQLFLPAEQAREQFNWYSHFLSGNALIKIVSYVLYASILLHMLDALVITIRNRKSGGSYRQDKRGRASKWYSRNMGILGTIILIFLVIHFQNFWYVYKFGTLPLDGNGHKDLYLLVVTTFKEWWYVLIYVLAMIALCYHLIHGVYSSIRTLGLFHPKYIKWLKIAGIAYSVIICAGFALMPVYVYFTID
ncbi:succinate dehydrogenase cytochrome b subunit [Sphingobacterium spiritivorum]|uniref:Succinate dehydrogenase cytochrome B subunit, b558 family n=1 Tax=Sphingobacterium spiritivorum ATCC 33861 TaxID=525373 RepID=D7VM86_SPHSI|nr:succinate dehydrogenase cytochrome b subunit [Sphingobacterium spiritivorum]EFK58091.1 succinate dehydrogenase cytochrome B subunit, b558 family [Sphingobacterium spiritivorum ATCC 33861]QQT34650.1 succinate dehydrogenase cytochrome b subunit [Sphingobacterium spiritivorum]WQD35533.1 succinate dehydrogenase cytochrome b subunit [Sphingobacterium spiritivorum]SUJ00743.1 succinate dehydrogenase (or fumarate reductase) cytochrome b subunit, b558 family [Sphingobacterium spiritivorum]